MKLGQLITEYIDLKQSLGMRFEANALVLRAFYKAEGDVDVQEVKSESVLAYLYGEGPVTSYWHKKFLTLTGLYRYAIARRYVAHSPLPTTIPKHPTPYVAYIYTPKELNLLLEAADTLETTHCHIEGLSFRTLLLLLFNTGLRIGEALSLTIADVSFSEDLLIIRDSKFGKSRFVPIDHRLGVVLQKYAEMKHAANNSQNQHSAFFVKRNGLPPTLCCVETTFRRLCNFCGIRREDGARYQPRLHDIRHSFAISRLLDWYKNGYDVQRLLPHLATYLGHLDISSTQHYLKMIPELLHEAGSLFERYALSEASHVK